MYACTHAHYVLPIVRSVTVSYCLGYLLPDLDTVANFYLQSCKVGLVQDILRLLYIPEVMALSFTYYLFSPEHMGMQADTLMEKDRFFLKVYLKLLNN